MTAGSPHIEPLKPGSNWQSGSMRPWPTMVLTWVFLATGFALGFVALFWLRRTGQMRLW